MRGGKHLVQRRSAFTLIEILIVVVAMSILAAIVLPQVGNSIEEAKDTTLLQNLQGLTRAIERYKLQHNGVPPQDLTGNTLAQLVSTTDGQGNIGAGASFAFGPYLVGGFPVNPLNNDARVFLAQSVPPTDLETKSGWIYDTDTGQIWAGTTRTYVGGY